MSTRGVARVGAVVALVLVVLLAVVWFGQRSMVFHPDTSDPGPASAHLENGADVTLSTADGLELTAWRVDPAGEARDEAVLYLPGNAGNRAGRASAAEALADEGFTVVLLDYRGFGGNPGSPSEDGLVHDAEAALAYLEGAGFPADRTILLGESIGTGVAVRLAAEHDPAAVLLRSPYTSLADLAGHLYGVPVGPLLRDRLDSIGTIGEVEVPVRVLAGEADTIVPASQSRALAEAAPTLDELVVVPGAGHNDALWFGPYLAEQTTLLADPPS